MVDNILLKYKGEVLALYSSTVFPFDATFHFTAIEAATIRRLVAQEKIHWQLFC